MTFFGTGIIHTLGVKSEIDSAKKAICWVNWDIDAEKFSV
jgi:internalin A